MTTRLLTLGMAAWGLVAGCARGENADSTSPDAGSLSEGDAAQEAGQGTGAQPACIRASSTPTSLGPLAAVYPDAIAVVGDRIFIASTGYSSDSQILVVNSNTHAQRAIRLEGSPPGSLVPVPDALFFVPGQKDPQIVDYAFSQVARLDLATERVSLLPNPVEYVKPTVVSLVEAKGDIYWILSEAGLPFALMRWASSTGNVETMLSRNSLNNLLTDGSTLYWEEWGNPARGGLWSSLPLDGVAPVDLFEWPLDLPVPSLLGVDEAFFYFLRGRDSGILAMPKTGGPEQSVVPGAMPLSSRFWLDGNHVYWRDTERLGLSRAPKTGGQTEIIWDGTERTDTALAFDACNIYWTVLGIPLELFVRAK